MFGLAKGWYVYHYKGGGKKRLACVLLPSAIEVGDYDSQR